ncbi:unnamed protein product [Trichogramma brassicae]|uniref:Uncharacterized protein n=1 Tax=Trichogramma brassicae TaxID=86971 RepID=A0A6H5IIW1_9HYME|nr:unnamed protein product [Trichogramma brassicae]
MMLRHDSEYYRSRKPKPELGRWESFKVFIWNPATRAFLDRTGREWGTVDDANFFFLSLDLHYFSIDRSRLITHTKCPLQRRKRKQPASACSTCASTACCSPPSSYSSTRRSSTCSRTTARSTATTSRRRGCGWARATRSITCPRVSISVKPDDIMARSNPPLILVSESTQRKSKAKSYVIAVRDMLGEYRNAPPEKYELECDERVLRDPITATKEGGGGGGGGGQEAPTKPCYFDLAKLGACSKSPYGYAPPIVDPCVYIKFNKTTSSS